MALFGRRGKKETAQGKTGAQNGGGQAENQQENQPEISPDAQKLLNEWKSLSGWNDSKEFKAIKENLEMLAKEKELDKRDMLCESLSKACKEYLGSREGARTDRGKERLALAERVLAYQKFTSCEVARDQIKAMDDEKVSFSSAMKITKYSKKYQSAYEAFRADPNKGAVNIDARNQLQSEMEKHLERNIDAVRSKIKLEEAIGQDKSWKEVEFPVPVISDDEKSGIVASGQSTRSVVTVNGKKGIFSEYLEDTIEDMVQNYISSLPPGELQSTLGEHTQDVIALCDEWKKITFGRGKENAVAEAKERLFRYMGSKLSEGDPEKQKEKYGTLMDLMETEAFDKVVTDLTERSRGIASMHDAAADCGIDYTKGKLDKRNELTSRMAQALGMEDKIAHSERIRIMRKGKILEGNFMEFAKGVDVKTKNEEEREIFKNATFDDPRFVRDANRIELFDFLCGQRDRHDGNLFYTFGEPDADGRRPIIGLQGIDNDMAFTAEDKALGELLATRDVRFIEAADREMMEAVQNLDREKLEFYLGDVLDQPYIDKMAERVDQMKERFKNGPLVDKGEWENGGPNVEKLREANGGPIGAIRNKGAQSFPHLPNQNKSLEQRKELAASYLRDANRRMERARTDYQAKAGTRKAIAPDRVKMNIKDLEAAELSRVSNKKPKQSVQKTNDVQKTTNDVQKTKEAGRAI